MRVPVTRNNILGPADKVLDTKRIHAVLLDSIAHFCDFCSTCGLTYTPIGGTMLGAIRHQGFIPWDDDADFGMPRPDYDRLLSLRVELEQECGLSIEGYGGLGLDYSPFVKLTRRDVYALERGMRHPVGLWIDVMPIDALPEDDAELGSLYRRASFLQRTIMFLTMTPEVSNTRIRRALKKTIFALGIEDSMKKIAAGKLSKLSQTYNWESTPYAGVLSWGLYGAGEKFPVGGIQTTGKVRFEGLCLDAMSCWDEYLTGIFGDYHELPPADKRITHGVIAWEVFENE